MKNAQIVLAMVLAMAASAVMVACGGGGGDTGPAAPAPVNATSVSGVISGFGSVIVGGREFATTATTRVVDGDDDDAPSAVDNLRVGMVVDVEADRMGRSANLLRFRSVVRGEVDLNDAETNTLVVLGQSVTVTSATSFSGVRKSGATATPITQLADIKPGDYVMVFGYIECPTTGCAAGSTQVTATLVHEPAGAGKYVVQGYVGNYSASPPSFTINGVTVTIATTGASPTVCNTMNCTFSNGDFVVVRAPAAPTGAYANPGSTLTLAAAHIVKRRDAPTFPAGSTVTLEGAVMQLSAGTFNLRGVPVEASADALKATVAGLANGQIVRVTGTISADGTLVATAITVERFATMMLMGPLDAAPTTSSLSVLGQVFTVTDSTRFADWAQGVRPFNAGNFSTVLKAGDQVLVSGFPAASGNVATRVERLPTPAKPVVAAEGLVTAENASATPPTLTLAGVTASIGDTTALFYPGAGRTPTAAGFFAAITPNTSLAVVFGTPGATLGTINAANARVFNPGSRWAFPH